MNLKLLAAINHKHLATFFRLLGIVYGITCLCLWAWQRCLMFHPHQELIAVPSSSPWNMPYQKITIPTASGKLKGWWISASPRRVKNSNPPVVLFLGGAAGNKSHYLDRVEGLRQLGVSLLLFDYRGYGESRGDFPKETQLYQDGRAAWDYLTQQQKIPPQHIYIYGESLGGAIALDLAVKQPQAAGLIVQSSFTSMRDMARWKRLSWVFPVDIMLNQKFDSITKVRALQIPVLFVHGTTDDVVPFEMGERLFAAAPSPKYLHVVPDAGHTTLLKPGKLSYVKAIREFIQQK